MPALRPIRFQLRLGSGSVARRALIGLVPMACFQASRFCGVLRFASKPTPSRVAFAGGSAIIVVIPLAASNQPIVIDLGNFAGNKSVPGPPMDEKAKRRENGAEPVIAETPLRGCEELVLRLHEEARAARWGLAVEVFSAALERAVRKRMNPSGLSIAQREEFL